METPAAVQGHAREMTRFEILRHKLFYYALQYRRRYIPHLVWWGDEIDILITFKENKLRARDLGEAMADLYSGSFYKAETLLHDVGITFDKGLGPDGRDWEWDWSLTGPVSVKFRRRAQKPERRT